MNRTPQPGNRLSFARLRPAWLIAVLWACASGGAGTATASELPRALHSLAAQTSDEAVTGDLAAMDAWQARLDSLPGATTDLWRAAAARAWLNVARAEYQDGDATGFPQAAFTRAVSLVGQIASGASPVSFETVPSAAPPRGSLRVDDSLYVELERMKRDPGFLCAADQLAQLETELAWAGNEQLDLGDCKSSPHLARARELAHAASRLVETCGPPLLAVRRTEPVPIPIAVSEPVPVPHMAIPTVEELRIPRNVHFALRMAEVTPVSLQVIDGIAALLDKYPSITARLEGHTDSRGNAAYNLDLSRRRVTAVRDVFVALGIDSTRLGISYKGKDDLVAVEDSKRGFALNRRVEMVFVDPDGRDIKATHQEGDIQLEADRPVPVPVRHPAKPGLRRSGVRTSLQAVGPRRLHAKPAATGHVRGPATASSTRPAGKGVPAKPASHKVPQTP